MSAPPVLTGTITFGDEPAFPFLAQARVAAQNGDWAAIEHAYRGAPGPAEQAAVARRIAESIKDPSIIDAAEADADADDTLPALIRGWFAIEVAWRARTHARAHRVSRQQFDTFHTWLQKSEILLIEVTAREPANVAAWSGRLGNARGLGLGLAESRRRYDRLAQHAPHHVNAQWQMLQQLCPKWGGSNDSMLAFVREKVAASPQGSLNGALLAEAHMEVYVSLDASAQQAYRRDTAVTDELKAAAARSVLHPAYRPVFNWVRAHSAFALIFSEFGDHSAALPHFQALGEYADDFVYSSYYGDAKAQFRLHRDAAIQRG